MNFYGSPVGKIKQEIVTKHYSKDGLKTINIQAFIEALKLSWIRRIKE